jgi:TetR/AcrR family transcriptional regulator
MGERALAPRAGGSGREQLMAAACRLMSARGTVDISIHEIALEAGMSSALIKYHFGHKDGLLLAILEKVIGDSVQRLQQLVGRPLPPAEKLRLHVEGVLNVYWRHPYVNRLMHYLLSTGEEARQRVSLNIVKPLLAAQARILREGAASGAFRHVDPTHFYFQVIGACDHLFFGHYALRYALGIDEISDGLRQRYARDLVSTILHGIEKEPTPLHSVGACQVAAP